MRRFLLGQVVYVKNRCGKWYIYEVKDNCYTVWGCSFINACNYFDIEESLIMEVTWRNFFLRFVG